MVKEHETILMFGLSPVEKTLVTRLVASFAIELVPLTINTARDFIVSHPEEQICLTLFRVDDSGKRQHRIIRLIRDFVGPLVPILIMVPRHRLQEVRRFLDAGADDYMELPLNQERFSISFFILLEMGQATLRAPVTTAPVQKTEQQRAGWRRIMGYFQDGLAYFSPRSLLSPRTPGNISERWETIKRLGLGGFGVVWLVRELTTGRLAVAKTPHSPQLNLRVLRSAAILKRLVHHPNIVELIEVVKDEGKFVLIQEYVDGKTLEEMLETSIDARLREDCFLQLLSVVGHAHKHNILHRDIKPENIMLTRTGQVKLLDFGIARDLSWQSTRTASEGSVSFMPPEQLEGHCTIASDVWALGVILYIFATNAVPYFLPEGAHNREYRCTLPHEINPSINRKLEEIIMKCFANKPDDRYPDGISLLQAIKTSLPQFGRGELLLS